jgi:hypothetical protein
MEVNPALLRLPPSRSSGPDPLKLASQISRFGNRSDGMPPILVTRGMQGEMMINDGVTRAFRIARLRPDATIIVEVIDDRPISLAHLPTVKERL